MAEHASKTPNSRQVSAARTNGSAMRAQALTAAHDNPHFAMHSGPQVQAMTHLHQAADQSPRVSQLAAMAAALQGRPGMVASMRPQPIPNRTGLPGQLKSGIESLSGLSMDDVRVHYGSDKPAQLNALAYAQGTDIHVAPGQEQHLPHEAWHVVQQKQGRVRATRQAKSGVAINDDAALEREADAMGLTAQRQGRLADLQPSADAEPRYPTPVYPAPVCPATVQRAVVDDVVQQFGVPEWLSGISHSAASAVSGVTRSAVGMATDMTHSTVEAARRWRRGPVGNTMRAQFNRQQAPPPARNAIVGNTRVALGVLDAELTKLPRLRELVDALTALQADAMLMQILQINGQQVGVSAKARARKRLYKDKRDLLALRLQIEKCYQLVVHADAQLAPAVIQGQVAAIKAAGAFLAPGARGPAITNTLTLAPANKTGRREPHVFQNNGAQVDDRSIDVRSMALAKAVQRDGFVPDLVIGLPTGGIQIAARIAGYFHATTLSAPRLMALRPRFVKPPGAGAAITPAEQTAINANDIDSTLMAHQLPHGAVPLKVLVVDDFSLSGGSVDQARTQIRNRFAAMHRAVDVRTAVSRYTSAQIGGTIGADNAPNPIDYLAGQHASGTRQSISGQFLVDDNRFDPSARGNQVLDTVGQGWIEQGEGALRQAD